VGSNSGQSLPRDEGAQRVGATAAASDGLGERTRQEYGRGDDR
jgi:hypothetical protein